MLKDILEYEFTLNDSSKIKLQDIPTTKGYVVFFFPKSSTPGCTMEGKLYNDLYENFFNLGYTIIGVSKDDHKLQHKFSCQYDFRYWLVSDIDSILCGHFDVIKEKSMMGKKYLGIERSTFLVDKNFNTVNEWRSVHPTKHIAHVLDYIKAL